MRFPNRVATPGAQAAAFTSALLIAQQVAGKAARDALFLSSFSLAWLPRAMAAGAGLSLVAVFAISRLITKYSPARVMPALFALNALGFFGEWALGLASPRTAAVLLYLQTAVLGPMTVSTFWSLINERFDPHTAKREGARIGSGGTLGGVLGGIAAWRASTLVSGWTFLLVLAALNAVAVVGTLLIRSRRDAIAVDSGDPPLEFSPLRDLRKTPFLRNLALLVALGSLMSAVLDFVFSTEAVKAYGHGAPLLAFFSLFWLAVGVGSFLVQIALGRVALEKLGVAISIAVLPGIVLLGGALGLAVPGLMSTSLLRGGEAVQRNTLFRTAYELLYTPLSKESKRATKALIDVGFDRIGTVLGSVMTMGALSVFGARTSLILLWGIVVFALLTLPIVRRIHIGYVAALKESLAEGDEKLNQALVPASRESGPEKGREALIEKVEALQPGGLTSFLSDRKEVPPASPVPTPAPVVDAPALIARVNALLSNDESIVRHALESTLAAGPEVACVVPLLAHPTLHGPAMDALRAIAPMITGQLVDVLLDENATLIVRRRIPRLFASKPTQRAADGLLSGISDSRFEIRYACGRALVRMLDSEAQPEKPLRISRRRVIEAIQHEVKVDQKLEDLAAEEEQDADCAAAPNALVDMLLRDRVDRSLEHVFTILSLFLDRKPLRMAFRALHDVDPSHRGTALEYLDTVLPPEVHDVVWPFLGEDAPLTRGRPPEEILATLGKVANG